MDKKYNGFNNGRDKSDGVGGREVNHGTQETMTKEQILGKVMPDYTGELTFTRSEVLQAMDDFANQQLSAERERAGKMVEALKVIAEKVGYIWVREDILKLIENYNAHEINS